MNRLPVTALVTSLATVLGGLAGGLLAAIIGARLGTSPGTDGFFAAYSLYSVAVVLAQSWNPNIVVSLVTSPQTFDPFNRLLGALALIVLGFGVLFVGLGDPLATLITGHPKGFEHLTARTALLVLWPVAAGQLFAGYAATVLNVLDKNAQTAVLVASGSLASIAAFLLLEPGLGVDALALSILIGTAVTVGSIVVLLLRLGWRPSIRVVVQPRLRALGLLLLSSVSNLVQGLFFTVSIVVAARVGPGAATVYSFAYFAQTLIKAFVTLSLPVVLARPLAATWDRSAAALRPYLDDSRRIGLVLLIPIVAAVVLLGTDFATAVLPKLTAGQIHEMIVVLLILCVSVVLSQVSIIEYQALMTLRRYTALAVVSLGLLAIQVLASLVADGIRTLYAVAAAFTVTVFARTAAFLWMIHGPAVGELVRTLVREAIPISLAAGASFGLGVLVVRPASALGDVAAYAIGLALFIGATTAFMPTYRVLALRLMRALRPAANARV